MTYEFFNRNIEYFNYKNYKIKYARDVTSEPTELTIKSIDIENQTIILKDSEVKDNE